MKKLLIIFSLLLVLVGCGSNNKSLYKEMENNITDDWKSKGIMQYKVEYSEDKDGVINLFSMIGSSMDLITFFEDSDSIEYVMIVDGVSSMFKFDKDTMTFTSKNDTTGKVLGSIEYDLNDIPSKYEDSAKTVLEVLNVKLKPFDINMQDYGYFKGIEKD